MASKEEYLALSDRVNSLKEKRAILVSNEAQKADERAELLEELKNAGVDPEHPALEIQRLELEIKSEYEEAKALVDQFEVELLAATGDNQNQEPPPQVSSNDLDLG